MKDGKEPYWPDNLLKRFVKRAGVRAKIAKRVGWHMLRHTYSTLLRANGTDIKVQQGMGAIAAVAGGGSLLPKPTVERLGIIHGNNNWAKKEWLLNRALRIDDDIAEALYSKNRLVPTYTKSQITPLKNN